ncbi:hypothetical protein EN786_28225 [Mesorhizobium sp. M4B.F.Ca.ET.143.01.1.1]|nr:hypothetical protein EN786_28225 [Mesorhizobium sp. M4B.F.Ca.ET.143.01.1.1]
MVTSGIAMAVYAVRCRQRQALRRRFSGKINDVSRGARRCLASRHPTSAAVFLIGFLLLEPPPGEAQAGRPDLSLMREQPRRVKRLDMPNEMPVEGHVEDAFRRRGCGDQVAERDLQRLADPAGLHKFGGAQPARQRCRLSVGQGLVRLLFRFADEAPELNGAATDDRLGAAAGPQPQIRLVGYLPARSESREPESDITGLVDLATLAGRRLAIGVLPGETQTVLNAPDIEDSLIGIFSIDWTGVRLTHVEKCVLAERRRRHVPHACDATDLGEHLRGLASLLDEVLIYVDLDLANGNGGLVLGDDQFEIVPARTVFRLGGCDARIENSGRSNQPAKQRASRQSGVGNLLPTNRQTPMQRRSAAIEQTGQDIPPFGRRDSSRRPCLCKLMHPLVLVNTNSSQMESH